MENQFKGCAWSISNKKDCQECAVCVNDMEPLVTCSQCGKKLNEDTSLQNEPCPHCNWVLG